MQTHGITYEQVALAAQKLLELGQSPTTKAVRAELGSGSQSTITKHLRQWRENESEKAKTNLESVIPKSLLAAIATELKKTEFEAIKNKEIELQENKKAFDELNELLAQEEENSKNQEEKCKAIESENQNILGKMAEMERQIILFRDKIEELNQKRTSEREEFAAIKSANEYISNDLKDKIELLNIEKEARLKAEIALARLEGQKDKI